MGNPTVREHVRTQRLLLVELVALVVTGVAGGLAVVVGFGWLEFRLAGPTVFAVTVAVALLSLLALGGLMWSTHFFGNAHLAHADPRGYAGNGDTVTAPDGTQIYVEVDGPAEAPVTVIFSHGWTCQTPVWRNQRDFLASHGVRAVFYDQRGHGRSGWVGMGEAEAGVSHLADDLAAVIAAAAPTGRIVLVGHSMGGMTAMAFSRRHRDLVAERVDAVILCATSAGPLGDTLRLGIPQAFKPAHWVVRRHAVSTMTLLGLMPRPMARLLGIGPYYFFGSLLAVGSKSGEARQLTARGLWETPLAVAGRTLKAVLNHDERAAVSVLSSKRTVVISGDRDRLIPYADQVELVGLIDGARHVTLPGIGHMVAQEAPDAVNDQLRDVLVELGLLPVG